MTLLYLDTNGAVEYLYLVVLQQKETVRTKHQLFKIQTLRPGLSIPLYTDPLALKSDPTLVHNSWKPLQSLFTIAIYLSNLS